MMPPIEGGNVAVFYRDGGWIALMENEADDILRAWTSGNTFYEGRGGFGQRVIVKLAEVNQICVWTPEQTKSSLEYEREIRARSAISGE